LTATFDEILACTSLLHPRLHIAVAAGKALKLMAARGENARRSFGYACAFRLVQSQISFKINSSFQS